MTKIYCDSPIHKVSSLALAFIIFAFCVLPSFASADSIRPNEPVGYKDGDTFRDILLAVLDSWGISFSKSDPTDETSILEYHDILMQQFYEDTQTNQELFWDLVKYGASETGNIILDFLGVNKIRQFANWLKDKFSLTDNSSVSTAAPSGYYLADGTPIDIYNGSSFTVFQFFTTYTTITGRTFRIDVEPNLTGQRYRTFTLYSDGVEVWSYRVSSADAFQYRFSYNPRFGFSYNFNTSGGYSSSISMNDISPDQLFGLYSSPGVIINTTIINIPSEDLDPEDGMEIEVPGTNWGDSIFTILDIIERLINLYDSTQLNINTVIDLISTLLQGLQQSVSVENIPGAVTLDYDDYDISLETDWSIVEGFFSDSEDSPFSALTAIIYGFPAPLILLFSVIVIFIVAYGFIRMGRDSH